MNAYSASTPTLRVLVGLATAAVVVIGMAPMSIRAQDDGERHRERNLRAVPFVFVGEAGDCGEFPPGSGSPYPAGSNIVTSAWLGGMGLPDNGGDNVGVIPTDNPNKSDPHLGLLLSKNGTTLDCSAAGARIRGVRGMTVDATFVLGFDYRNGSHCTHGPEGGGGATGGAPRFNVVVENSVTGMTTFHTVGNCNVGTNTTSQQDGEWTTITFTPAQAVPPIPPGSRIRSITLMFDEGTDQPSANPFSLDPSGIGLAVLDNININGKIIRSGRGIEDDGARRRR